MVPCWEHLLNMCLFWKLKWRDTQQHPKVLQLTWNFHTSLMFICFRNQKPFWLILSEFENFEISLLLIHNTFNFQSRVLKLIKSKQQFFLCMINYKLDNLNFSINKCSFYLIIPIACIRIDFTHPPSILFRAAELIFCYLYTYVRWDTNKDELYKEVKK